MLGYCQLGSWEIFQWNFDQFKKCFIQKNAPENIVCEIAAILSRGRWVNTLPHWGRVMHICVSKQTSIGSDNGLSPGRRQAIIWTNAGILLLGPLGTNFSEIWIEIHILSFKKMHLKMSSGKWRPFCFGLIVLRASDTWAIWHWEFWITLVQTMAWCLRAQAIMFTNADVLSVVHWEKKQWNFTSNTTISVKKMY